VRGIRGFLVKDRERPVGVVIAKSLKEVAEKIGGELEGKMIAIPRERFTEVEKGSPYAEYCLAYQKGELYFTLLKGDEVLLLSVEEIPILP
jgi:hypothetical protein